ncbi:DUF1772 domain-containing protein [Alteromonas facilis]|uniref:anthrone oxygenase family protein n=1 Tax=Alteromonas facilis TaxID=2048004 RepID=UPI000C288D45|nr:anthrone oxygenase family protein [Alteromonas facilis]
MLETGLLVFVAIASALMGGIYFAFSGFIMKSLSTMSTESAVDCMNSINREIVNSFFLPLFFLSTMVCATLVFVSEDVSVKAGALTYIVGMFVCTVVKNVPLNNRLEATTDRDREDTWAYYLSSWTRWNHVRTVSCIVASLVLFYALTQR